MKTFLRYMRAFLIILFCLYSGIAINKMSGIAIPGSMIGLMILFTGLVTQLVPVNWVAPCCQLPTRFMPLFFVPVCVGVIEHTEVLATQFAPIVGACLISTLIVLITTALIPNRLQRAANAANDKTLS